jgi:hypothetical protein
MSVFSSNPHTRGTVLGRKCAILKKYSRYTQGNLETLSHPPIGRCDKVY